MRRDLLDAPKVDRLYEFSRWLFYLLTLVLGVALGLIVGFYYGSVFGFAILPSILLRMWGN